MYYSLGVKIGKNIKKLRHNSNTHLLIGGLSNDFFEKLASLAKLHDEDITRFIIVNLE